MLNRIKFAVLAGPALLPFAAAAQEAAVVAQGDLAPAIAPVGTDAVTSVAGDSTANADVVLSVVGDRPAGEAVLAEVAAATETPLTTPPLAVTIPRLTPLVIELLATLSSETSAQGDHFPIRLFEPVVIDGVTVIPAGTSGEGEVIHAKRKGGMGTPGELIITARWLDLAGQRVPLRSLRVNGDGQSRIDTVNTIAVASAATIPLASLVGFFITGGAKTVNEGTIASARTAEDFAVAAPQADAERGSNAPADAAPAQDEIGDPAETTPPSGNDEEQGSQQEGID